MEEDCHQHMFLNYLALSFDLFLYFSRLNVVHVIVLALGLRRYRRITIALSTPGSDQFQ